MKKVIFICATIVSAICAQCIIWLGSMETPYAEAHGVSVNGQVVAGWAGVSDPHYAFRWTPDSGMRAIGSLLPGEDAEAWGMSADGRVIVGYGMLSGSIYHGFRFVNDTMYEFGTLGGNVSWAYGASFDGSVVVGSAETLTGFNRAFRWTQDSGMKSLGVLPGALRSVARGVSFDGRVVVGWSGFSNQVHHAFRWQNGVMSDIHNPQFGQSEAIGVSGDGNVVVGACGTGNWVPTWAFRWSAATGMVSLGTLGGEYSEAWAANEDGSIVVGWSERSQGNWGAFRWTEQSGMEDLNIVYAQLLPTGSILRDAMAISPDGRFIAGRGYNSQTGRDEVYLLDTGAPGIAEQSVIRSNSLSLTIHPNPITKKGIITYNLPEITLVQLGVYDVSGREIARLVDGATTKKNQVQFSAVSLPAGTYICRLQANGIGLAHLFVKTR